MKLLRAEGGLRSGAGSAPCLCVCAVRLAAGTTRPSAPRLAAAAGGCQPPGGQRCTEGGCRPLALRGWAHRCPPCQALPGSLAGGVPLRPPAGAGARHGAGEVSWPPPESQLRCPRARSPPGAPGQGDTGVSLALCLEEGGTVRSGHYPQDAGGVGTWVSPLSLHPDRSSPRSLFGTFLLLASPPQDWGHVCN